MQDFGLDDRTKGPLNYPKYQDIMAAYMKKLGYECREVVVPRGFVFIWCTVVRQRRSRACDTKLLPQLQLPEGASCVALATK